MPTLLSFTNVVSNANEKDNVNQVKELENQLEQGSVQAAIDLTAFTGFKHDTSNSNTDCYQCNKIANYFIIAFQSVKSQPLQLHAALLTLVTQTIDLIQSHNMNTNYTWLTILMKELRDLGKRIRDESAFSDKFVPLPLPSDFSLQQEMPNDTVEEQYGRAIRISIYHCRALMNPEKSTHYYRKCLSIAPSHFDYLSLQQSAKQRVMTDQRPFLISSQTSSTVSSSSSTSSGASMTCASCGLEKKRMPVCSKCKSQSYCSIRCLKKHKPIHDLDCH